MKSLVVLAKKGGLPKIQHMDAGTLSWIEATGLSFGLRKNKCEVAPFVLESVKRYVPKQSWFFNRKCYSSLHGVRHISRVVANVANLALGRKFNSRSIRNVLIAASLHDIGRHYDRKDLEHSRRAADWFSSNVSFVQSSFGVNLVDNDIEEIYSTICYHNSVYSKTKNDVFYVKYMETIELLKTADAMDRYRLPNLRWWPNERFFVIKPTLGELKFAFSLLVFSEQEHLKTGTNYLSVLNSLQ